MLAQMIRNRLMISLHRRRKKKTRAVPDSARQNCLFSLIFRLTAGFGTLRFPQVAGLHRAVPSTALDKVFNCGTDYSRLSPFVKNCFRILRLRACHLEEQRDEGSYSGRWCTFLLLVQKKGTKENDTREGNCGLALPVAGEARPQFPQPRHKVNCRTAAIHLAVPEKCCGLTLFLAFFDRCGKGTSPSSATGGGLVPFPLPGPTLIETTKRGLRAPFGFPRDSPGNDGRFE